MINHKKSGFFMLILMLIISSLTILVVGVGVYIYSCRNMISTLSKTTYIDNLLDSGIALAYAHLNGHFDKKEKKAEEKVEKSNKSNEEEEKIFNRIQKLIYTKKTYTFPPDHYFYGFGELTIYISTEDGKIPLRVYLQELHQELNKKKSTTKESKESEENEEIKKEDEKDNDEATQKENPSNKSKENPEKNCKERIKNLIEILGKQIQISSLKEQENKKLPDYIYSSLKEEIEKTNYSSSLMNMFKTDLNSLYSSKIIKTKNKEKVKLGEIFSLENDGCNAYYFSPAILRAFGLTVEDIMEEKDKEKFLEEIKNVNIDSLEKIIEIYKKIYQTNLEIPEELKNIIKFEKIPQSITFTITAIQNDLQKTAFAVFEKKESSGKSNSDYLLKHLYYFN